MSTEPTPKARDWLDGADPSWYPRVLRTLARDYPKIAEKVWLAAIQENAEEQVARARAAAGLGEA